MNRLAYEKSPYLLQHAHNPVDWYPWGREVFEKAAREDKPVFLSIGYSTCHWCHVMERESFENPETAAILNANFVSVKVDREERPDIDQVYMGYVTASTGSGGWPMSVFLTPEQKPFYGGTYFPPKEAYGIPSFPRLLQALALSWKSQRNEIILSSESAVQYLNAQGTEGAGLGEAWDGERLKAAALQRFEQQYDEDYAGFGRAPKFPRAHALQFLLRTAHSSVSTTSKKMAEETLNAMADGGIYDVLEGGFHRYSTDARWRIPHFEKMLYDQAVLVRAYTEAFRLSPNPVYEQVIRRTLEYVENRLTDSSGAFYSAEDADSEDPQEPGRKKEGAFFLWKKTELEKILGPQDAQVACRYFGVEEEGNALSDPHGEFKGLNVLYKACSLDDLSHFFEKQPEDLRQTLDRIREKLLRERECRPRPHRDEKILTDWNALMIAAFAEASRVLDEPRYADAALRAAKALQNLLRGSGGRWHHSYCKGHQGAPANLADVAFLADAFLSLYEATSKPAWLEEACRLADGLAEDFEDKEKGGFFFTSTQAERLIYRPKEFYDGALPSGNSAAACMLARLSCFSQNEKYGKIASRVLDAFAPALRMDPSSAPVLLMTWDWLGPSARQVRIVSGSGGDEALQWKRAAGRSPHPWQAVVAVCEEGESVYAQICENRTCGLPIRNFEEFQKRLGLLKS